MVKKIVLTGGPGSGKTKVLESLVSNYKEKGYKVIVVPETATELITNGISPADGTISMLDFQDFVLMTQLSKEAVVNRMLEFSKAKDTLIICDRGTLDGLAYVSKDDFELVLRGLKLEGINSNVLNLLNAYDLVIDLVGSKEFYTTENNKARRENPDEAMDIGKKTLKAWLGHNKLKIVLPQERIEDKINKVISIIDDLLEEVQIKKQRKFAVDLSKTDLVKIQAEGRALMIEQTYLDSDYDEARVRKITFNGVSSYQLTTYENDVIGNKVIKKDEQICKAYYEHLADENSSLSKPKVKKVRYYFAHNGQYFTLDVFENLGEIGILEINAKVDEMIDLPPYVSVLEDVTKNKDFLNVNIANSGRMELKKV